MLLLIQMYSQNLIILLLLTFFFVMQCYSMWFDFEAELLYFVNYLTCIGLWSLTLTVIFLRFWSHWGDLSGDLGTWQGTLHSVHWNRSSHSYWEKSSRTFWGWLQSDLHNAEVVCNPRWRCPVMGVFRVRQLWSRPSVNETKWRPKEYLQYSTSLLIVSIMKI